jgi:hypothetical protein
VSLIFWSIPRNRDVSKIGPNVLLHCYICRKRVNSSYGLTELNTTGSDLKPYLIRFWTHVVWICSWQQIECYHYNKLEDTTRYVPIGDSHQNVEFCSNRKIAPRNSNSVGLVVSKM